MNIVFDVVTTHKYAIEDNELRDMITDRMKAIDSRYNCVIQIDKKD